MVCIQNSRFFIVFFATIVTMITVNVFSVSTASTVTISTSTTKAVTLYNDPFGYTSWSPLLQFMLPSSSRSPKSSRASVLPLATLGMDVVGEIIAQTYLQNVLPVNRLSRVLSAPNRWAAEAVNGSEVPAVLRYTRIYVPRHGFISEPKSRVLMCKEGLNKNCGAVRWEPQSVEGEKGFPQRGPRDGHIVGADKFDEMDEYGANRWRRVNIKPYLKSINFTHVSLQMKWQYTAKHKTSAYHLFGTIESYDADTEPLKRSNLCYLDTVRPFSLFSPVDQPRKPLDSIKYSIERSKLYRTGVLLVVWDIADTDRAFYQAIDYKIVEKDDEDDDNLATTDFDSVEPATTFEHKEKSTQIAIVPNKCYNSFVLYRRKIVRSLCDCHAFYQLLGHEGVLMYCPAGLVFNQLYEVCDWPYNVNTSDIPCDD